MAGLRRWLAERGDFDLFLLAGRYTLLEQEALESFLPLCEKRGIGIVLGGPYNSGILATGPKPGAFYNYSEAPQEILDRVARIEAVCKRHGVRLVEAALQFPLHASERGLGHPGRPERRAGARPTARSSIARSRRRCGSDLKGRKGLMRAGSRPTDNERSMPAQRKNKTRRTVRPAGFGSGKAWEEEEASPYLAAAYSVRCATASNFGAANTQVVQFAVRQAAQLVHGVAIAAPVAVVADQVHLTLSFRLWFVHHCHPQMGGC